MLLLICLLVTLFFVMTFGNLWKDKKLIKLSQQLKSDTPCWPLVGHAYKFIGNQEDHMRTITEHFGREMIKQGGLTSFWMGNTLAIGIADAADADFVLKSYLEKGFFMKFIQEIIGNGNFVAPVSIWRPRRKILIRTLSPKNLQSYTDIFVKYSRIMVKLLESKLGTGPFSIGDYFNTYTVDSMCVTSFGEDLQIDQKSKFVEAMKDGYRIAAERIVSPWQYNTTIFKLFPTYYMAEKLKRYCDDYFGTKISAKRRELQEENKKKYNNDTKKENDPKSFKSFMELLLEANYGNRQYTDKEVQEEILVLFMAGSDSTASTSGFATVMLARHPDVQEKVYEELKKVFGDSTSPITAESLTKLKFLDAVIKETLRLYGPLPVIARNSDRELTLPSGVTIPSNYLLIINLWALHRNPKYWGSDAEQFRPERWLDVNSIFKHPAQYIPFGSGPRNCAGYKFAISSIKVLLSTMLLRYQIMPDTGLTIDGAHKPLRLKFAITIKDSDNFVVSLKKRI